MVLIETPGLAADPIVFLQPPPPDQTVTVGQQVVFTVVLGGDPPYALRWRHGLNTVGFFTSNEATNSFTINNVTLAQAGNYSVVASNDFSGPILLGPWMLTVEESPQNLPPTISDIPDQTIDEDTSTPPLPFMVGDPDTPLSGLMIAALSDNQILLPDSNILLGGVGPNRTVRLMPRPNRSGTTTVTLALSDGQWSVTNSFLLTVNPVNDPPFISDVSDLTINANETLGPVGFIVGDIDNLPETLIVSAQSDNQSLLPDANIILEEVAWNPTNRTASLTPVPDQFGMATVTLSASDGGFMVMDTFVLTVNQVVLPPTITKQPIDQSVNSGATVTFTVEATGTAPLLYQWRKDNVTLPAANSPTLTLPNVQLADAGSYDVVVSNPIGSATSATVTLVVQDQQPPVITQQPVSQTVVFGATVIFTVEATGTPPLQYQWQFNGVSIPNAVESTLTLENVQPNDEGSYTVVITNEGGSTTSEPGELVVYRVDFGDAPDSPGMNLYHTLLTNNGARHLIDSNLVLGVLIDGEPDGQPNSDATGDGSDEDGIKFLTDPLVPGMPAQIEVTTTIAPGISARLNAWIDFNLDRSYTPSGLERILTNEVVTTGVRVFDIIVPAGAVEGTSFARFRLHRNGTQSIGPAGAAPLGEGEDGQLGSGEVEDYAIEIFKEGGIDLSVAKTADADPTEVGDLLTYTITAANAGPDTALNAVVTDALPPDVAVLSASFPGSTCDVTGNIVTCALGDLPAAATSVITIEVIPLTSGVLTNCAAITGEGTELNPADNSICITTTAENRPEQVIPCDQSNKGTDFWLTFPGNYAPDPAHPPRPLLCIIGTPGQTGNVTMPSPIPGEEFFQNFIIPDTMQVLVELPAYADLGDLNDDIVNRGIHVTGSDKVAVFAMNKVRHTSDAYLALPSIVTGTEYVVQAWGNVQTVIPELNGSQFAIVACESNTVVTITPSTSIGDLTAGESYTRILQEGDVYQLRDTNDLPNDLTGTIISASKPVSVFAGHMCANIPNDDVFACDYVVEQLLPSSQAGTEFITVPLYTRDGDTFRVLAVENNTTVTVDGAIISLNRGQHHDTALTAPSRITSTKPVLVTQFANSSDYDNVTEADPFMTIVPGVERFLTTHMICVPETGFANNYANVVIPSGASLTLNGAAAVPLPPTLADVAGFSLVRLSLPPGTNILDSTEPFGSIIYGFNEFESYGYPGALFFGDTQPPTIVCPVTAGPYPVTDPDCTRPLPDLKELVEVLEDECTDLQEIFITQDPPAGTPVGPGTYDVEVHATDKEGNRSTCIITVTIYDGDPPRIDCPANRDVPAMDDLGADVTFTPSAVDDCDPAPTVECDPPSGHHFPIGTTTVTCTATDESGNSSMCTFLVTVEAEPSGLDYGDAPDPTFPTLDKNNGARHEIVAGWHLGAKIDADMDGHPSADALGDDTSGTDDDEDGVFIPSILNVGQLTSIEIVASTTGKIDAWIDFNRNGAWEMAEQIFISRMVGGGTNRLAFMIPVEGVESGQAFARFRFSEAGGLSPRGYAQNGEVEDYLVYLSQGFDGQVVVPEGSSTITVVSNKLVVEGIGTTGDDGVAIPVVNQEDIVWQGSFDSVVVNGPDTVLNFDIYGNGLVSSEVLVARAGISNNTETTLTWEFPRLPAGGSLQAELFLGGVLLGTIDMADQGLQLSAVGDVALNRAAFTLDAVPFFTFEFDQPLEFSRVGNGTAPMIADTAVLQYSPSSTGGGSELQVASTAPTQLRRIVITAAHLPSFVISQLESSPPIPRLRILYLPDGQLALIWLKVPLPFRPEGAPSLIATSWGPVIPNTSETLRGRRVLRITPADDIRFFRLISD